MNFKRFLCLVAFLALAHHAGAATITKSCPPDWNTGWGGGPQSCFMSLTGEIVAGDAQQLKNFMKRPENFEIAKYGNLHLESSGGDVLEAIKISSLLKQYYVYSSVSSATVCASSCFLIWVGSATHYANVAVHSQIGLHRPYYNPAVYKQRDGEAVAAKQGRAMSAVREYLNQQNLPQRLTDAMMQRASNDVYWLTEADAREIGPYAPWFEEVLIAECGYNKRAIAIDLETAMKTRGQDVFKPWRDFVNCENTVILGRRVSALQSAK